MNKKHFHPVDHPKIKNKTCRQNRQAKAPMNFLQRNKLQITPAADKPKRDCRSIKNPG